MPSSTPFLSSDQDKKGAKKGQKGGKFLYKICIFFSSSPSKYGYFKPYFSIFYSFSKTLEVDLRGIVMFSKYGLFMRCNDYSRIKKWAKGAKKGQETKG